MNPFQIFGTWYAEVHEKGIKEPTAMNLATVSRDGRPSSRIVLLKHWDEKGFVFYTNSQSKKGGHILINPHVALNFFWPDLHKQVRIEGPVEEVRGKEADDYYNSRDLGRRIGAWASQQSQILPDRQDLLNRAADYEMKYGSNPPRPPHWFGYRVKPIYFEFWSEGEARLHDRDVYEGGEAGVWQHYKLYP